MATEIKHSDKLGSELLVGDFVLAPYGNRKTMVAQIKKLSPKMITITKIGAKSSAHAYPDETVKLDPNLVTMYLLRLKK